MHAYYHDYHMGVGAFFGKRVFAVMNDGFKVQHHAMEFKRPTWLDLENILLM